MLSLDDLKKLIADVLQTGDRLGPLGRDAALMGGIPEFDSMAVVSVLTRFEEDYGVVIDDDEITAEQFETFGNLLDFLNSKLA